MHLPQRLMIGSLVCHSEPSHFFHDLIMTTVLEISLHNSFFFFFLFSSEAIMLLVISGGSVLKLHPPGASLDSICEAQKHKSDKEVNCLISSHLTFSSCFYASTTDFFLVFLPLSPRTNVVFFFLCLFICRLYLILRLSFH